MPEKRKLPTRGKKESAKKKHSSRVVDTPPPETQESEQEEEEALPTRIKNDSPLPTVLFGSIMDDHGLQSIAESGVLAASLSRSHQVWLTENLFERYWAKPSKKKGWVEPPNNPGKDKMTRAGSCQIIIEPHIMDATIYGIKQPNPAATSNTPVAKIPILHYNPPVASSSTPQAQTQTLSQSQSAASTPQKIQVQQTPAVSPSKQTQVQPSAPEPVAPKPAQTVSAPNSTPSTTTVPNKIPQSTSATTPNTSVKRQPAASSSTSQPAANQAGHDPVIQKLAQRAATNPELKLLMKIVASGGASSEQLKTFQGHIDELTAIIKREREDASRQPPVNPQVPKPSQNTTLAPPKLSMASQQGKFSSIPAQTPSFTATPPMKISTPKPPKNEIVGAAIEFNEPGASGDRYLFPRNSVLEISHSAGQITASFLLVRKPTAASGAKYKEKEEYYQPVTLKIISDTPKVLDILARAVAPIHEVNKYMQDIIAKKKRAEHVQLVLKLPIDTEPIGIEESGSSTPVKSKMRKSSYAKNLMALQSSVGLLASRDNPKDKVDTWQDRHCQFCLTMVPSAAAKENGQPMCNSCESLRRINRLKHPFENHGQPNLKRVADVKTSGPRTLFF